MWHHILNWNELHLITGVPSLWLNVTLCHSHQIWVDCIFENFNLWRLNVLLKYMNGPYTCIKMMYVSLLQLWFCPRYGATCRHWMRHRSSSALAYQHSAWVVCSQGRCLGTGPIGHAPRSVSSSFQTSLRLLVSGGRRPAVARNGEKRTNG